MTNLGFSAAAFTPSAPGNDWPVPGARGIAFDVTLSPDAQVGGRALILRHTGYPDERQLVFGFLEIYDEGTASILTGDGNPSSGWIRAIDSEKPMLQIALSSGPFEPLRLRTWTVTHTGTGDTSKVTDVRIYADFNGNGLPDPEDKLVGTGTFSGNISEIRSVYSVTKDTIMDFLITYEFATEVEDTSTYRASIEDLAVTGVDSARSILPVALPVFGNMQTMDVTPPTIATVAETDPVVDELTNDHTVDITWTVSGDSGSGVAGYSWALDQSPGTVPDSTLDGAVLPSSLLLSLGNGIYHLHVRAQDAAGNWSGTYHHGPWVLDTTASAVAAPTFSPGPGLYPNNQSVQDRLDTKHHDNRRVCNSQNQRRYQW